MSAIAINVMDFVARASELITNLKRDEEIILTNNENQVVAKLVPAQEQVDETPKVNLEPRKIGMSNSVIWISPDFDEPLEDFKEYMP